MTTPLTITASRTGSTVQCVATGELDLSTVEGWRSALLAAAQDAETLRLDLSGLSFIDTTGLGALLELHVTFVRAGVGCGIAVEEGAVRQAVQSTGLSHFLTATAGGE